MRKMIWSKLTKIQKSVKHLQITIILLIVLYCIVVTNMFRPFMLPSSG